MRAPPRLLLDACVLVPTLTRALLSEAARAGAFTPLWSPKIFAEWKWAAERYGPVDAALAEAEQLRLCHAFPDSTVTPAPKALTDLYLPDEDDRHVLAAAIKGRAEGIVTFNLRDFPVRALAPHGVHVRDPDLLLCEVVHDGALQGDKTIEPALRAHLAEGERATGQAPRALLKRAQLPRLGKLLYA